VSDDGVLTSSWCTNWGAFNTPRLWAMVSDEDDPDAWRQVAAWGQVSVAVGDHRARLQQAREALAAAWPPESGSAAEAFVTELDTLIVRMDSAARDADTTATGLANILEALRTAKNQIQPLYEEYKSKSDDLVPSWWDNAEDEIDQKAQAHMVAAEQAVQQHVAQLKVPDAYTMDPKGGRSGFDDPTGPGTSPGSSGSGGGAGRSGSRGAPVTVPHDPPPPMPGQDATVPDADAPGGGDGSGGVGGGGFGGGSGGGGAVIGGPGLAGGVITPPPTGTPPAGAPGTPGALPGSGGPPPGGTGGGPVVGGPVPGVLPGGLGVGGGGGGGLGGVPGGVGGYARGTRPVAGGIGTGRALPSGAVIGETVGGARGGAVGGVGGALGGGVSGRGGSGAAGGVSGRGVSGRGFSGAAGGRTGAPGTAKPKPPPWLPEDDETRGAARAGGAAATSSGMTGGRRGNRRDSEYDQPFDPDNPWAVAEGVEPVIRPSDDDPRHDPGPNVIGRHG
jgi:hypothetical protein